MLNIGTAASRDSDEAPQSASHPNGKEILAFGGGFGYILLVKSALPHSRVVGAGLAFLAVALVATACGVKRGEFDELSGRVANLEDIVIAKRTRGESFSQPSGGSSVPTAPGAWPPPIPTEPAAAGAVLPPPVARAAQGPERSRYNQAQSLLKSKQFAQAEAAFRALLQDFPDGALAPNSRYWLGECRYAVGDFQGALAEFRKGLADWPASNKAPDCLLKISYCQSRLGDGPGAMDSLQQLLTRYPQSPSAQLIHSGRARFRGP
jgi:tol-pal system protein YbgF